MFARCNVSRGPDVTPFASAVATNQRVAGERAAKAVTALAALAALAVAIACPAAYFLGARDRLLGVLEVSANAYADAVAETTAQSPDLWNALLGSSAGDLSSLPIASADDAAATGRSPERRQVIGVRGNIVLDSPAVGPLSWPTLSVEEPVMENGQRFGKVRVSRTFRPQAISVALVSAGSIAFGFLLLAALRIVPLRLLREALERIAFLAGHDSLTGLPNRAVLFDRLQQALAVSRQTGDPVAAFCLDLDHFKAVNDTLGHGAGDKLLRIVAARLRTCLREVDTLTRLGGDEFAVVQPRVLLTRDIELIATRMIEAVKQPIDLDGQQVYVGLSLGIAISSPASDAAEMIAQADVALYQAKMAGRGGYCFFAPEMNEHLRLRRVIENDLRAALANGSLAVHYQPQLDLDTGKILGAEALMRWAQPGDHAVSPAVFIPVAEETGLIVPIGEWLLRQACQDAMTWPASMRIAVNISPVQFRSKNFLEVVTDTLAATGLPADRLELEVTEGILLRDTEETLTTFRQLHEIGVRLALDDFGTGYASLGYLQKFRFDKIKIDRSFIRNLGVDPNAAAIVSAVVGLSGALGIYSNAEGVERDDQEAVLRAHGCREVQGFRYWEPMPNDAIRRIVMAPGQGTTVEVPAGGNAMTTEPNERDGAGSVLVPVR